MRNWTDILRVAKEIVESYDTPVTLRQLYYRLVSREILENTQSCYTQLSSKTAEARRLGLFPAFLDKTRNIIRYREFDSPQQAMAHTARNYRRDRSEGQPYTIFLAVEKDGLTAQLEQWFGHLSAPIMALRGYSSQSFADVVREQAEGYARPAILIYAGDFDPSGEDILRAFVKQADCFDGVERVALNREQIEEYNLPPLAGKSSDTRSRGFIQRHGELMQVEVDALDPEILRGLFDDALAEYVDVSMFENICEIEEQERQKLIGAINLLHEI